MVFISRWSLYTGGLESKFDCVVQSQLPSLHFKVPNHFSLFFLGVNVFA